jgi:hypothetical protein
MCQHGVARLRVYLTTQQHNWRDESVHSVQMMLRLGGIVDVLLNYSSKMKCAGNKSVDCGCILAQSHHPAVKFQHHNSLFLLDVMKVIDALNDDDY